MLQSAAMFVYHFFYPFAGCLNQLMATNFGGKFQGAEVYSCGHGTMHEGKLCERS